MVKVLEIPQDNTRVQTRDLVEYLVPDDIKLLAALKGMTVEEYLQYLASLLANKELGSGVIVDGDNPLPFIAKVSTNPLELSRISSLLELIKLEALKVVNGVLGITLPSTWINLGLKANGLEEMPLAASLAVDFAPAIFGLGFSAAKKVAPIISNNYRAYRISKVIDKNIKQGIQLGLYYHGSPNRNISVFKTGKDGGIYFTQNRNAAKLYTGIFGTGKVYNANLDLGNKIITIDNNGAAWTKIPENKVAKAFNLTPQQVHDIIGSYNLGEVPWHYGFTKTFGYKPKSNYYAIDQVVKLGKDLGISSLIINNTKDNGKRLFSRTMPYDLTVVYDPRQIIMGGQIPNLKLYGIYKKVNDGLIRLGYTTSGIKQTKTPTGNSHWREDITDIDNPILLDIKPDMHYIKTHTTPIIKEIINVDDILLHIGIVPIHNTPVLEVEKITVNPVNRLIKVGERSDLTLSPNRVVQFKQSPRLVDNKSRLISSDANRYFWIPTKTEVRYTLWHKSGGSIKIKNKNCGNLNYINLYKN